MDHARQCTGALMIILPTKKALENACLKNSLRSGVKWNWRATTMIGAQQDD
jgi:hypothetical protein